MTSSLVSGGLGAHTIDELQSILAGKQVSFGIDAAAETFRLGGRTTPQDLELQLQLMAAALTDAAYRPQGEAQYRRSVANYFARLSATPELAIGTQIGGILSDGDPRFSLQPEAEFMALTFADLRADIADRLGKGAMELALVGDFDEAAAIDLVARTLGALPRREPQFRSYAENRQRGFTADRSPRVLYHDGAADQALIQMTWPTTDDSDFRASLTLELLERVARLELTDTLREELGQTYSPSAGASQSRVFPGYGTFEIAAAVDAAHVDEAREAMLEAVRTLAAEPVDEDMLLRARQPLLESYDNALKTNGGWLGLVDRAQTEPERIERFTQGKTLLASLTAADLQAMAARYLVPEQRLEVVALPRPAPAD
jgi:zinc protease